MKSITTNLDPEKKTKLKIKLLRCYTSSEANGDEVYLKYEGRKFWPAESFKIVNSYGELPVNVEILLDTSQKFARIDLWESDLLLDDHLGFFLFSINGSRGEYATDLTPQNTNQKCRYSLVWGV